ncbi:agmatine/peptidylarginine deiminase [Alkalilimnicola sp. S0819]|uniref:agmatine deiminase family protein n=1 Tax=Alkalilimnicola sp. S0819 TaxID=2613922 RepID=UPI001261A1B5|nr:agmatine deiminase family protein [Alkalilimnicola sp. S0819]KAB7627637.1 agmatine deiminase family protein [Alkalilimnicola sp. S0819]MPQ15802.1 agmatine deiminase [Alkalilimnicola sp. S0819]
MKQTSTGRIRRLPAEWEPQSAIQLTWPHPEGDWGALYAAVEAEFLGLAATIARFQYLLISCADNAMADALERKLSDAGVGRSAYCLVVCPSDDVWCRDHGPLTVYETATDGKAVRTRLQSYRFNGWGGKYASERDDALVARLHRAGIYGDAALDSHDWVLEGGSVDSDGRGSLLTTRACLLNPNRNPDLDQAAIEQRLRDELGTQRVLWLAHGELAGDDTDSHIDMLARFTDPDTIAYVRCDRPEDPHHAPLQAMERELRALRRADGGAYRLAPLPWPEETRDAEGQRLPLSYANFLIINQAVLVPQYGVPQDPQALEILHGLYPEREVIGVAARAIIEQYGSLHCVSMQLPQGIKLPRLGSRIET